MRSLTKIFLVVLGSSICLSASAQGRYSVIDIGSLGGSTTFPRAINRSGEIVGDSIAPTGYDHAFLFDGLSMHDLGVLPGGRRTIAFGMNSSGIVVGNGDIGGTQQHPIFPFYYDGTGMHELNLGPNGIAQGVNDGGVIVGTAQVSGNAHAFIYSGSVQYLGAFGGNLSSAVAINFSGQVAGQATIMGDAHWHAFLFSGSLMQDLGTLPQATDSFATSINNNAQIGGYSLFANQSSRAFLFDTSMHDLRTLPGCTNSAAYGINNLGQLVGSSWPDSGLSRAMIYSGGTMRDLNTLLDGTGTGCNLTDAMGINDRGQIAAHGLKNGNFHGFLLTPRAQPVSSSVRGGGG